MKRGLHVVSYHEDKAEDKRENAVEFVSSLMAIQQKNHIVKISENCT